MEGVKNKLVARSYKIDRIAGKDLPDIGTSEVRMQYNNDKQGTFITRPRLGRTRVVGMEPGQPSTNPLSITGELPTGQVNENTGAQAAALRKTPLPAIRKSIHLHLPTPPPRDEWNVSTDEGNDQNTAHLMQLSGMMRSLRKTTGTAPLPPVEADEDGYWPLGIQQTGPLSIINIYGNEPFGRTLPPAVPVVMPDAVTPVEQQQQPTWRRVLGQPSSKISSGVLIGVVLFFLAAHFVDLPRTLQIVQTHLFTAQGIGFALLTGVVYLAAYSFRSLRWGLFLNPVGQVSVPKVVEIYQVATFLNFLLPVRSGEAAKSLMLKRIAAIPMSKSLPTVGMDKALDFLLLLVVVALIPFMGVQMSFPLWLLFIFAVGGLLGLLLFMVRAIWQQSVATDWLQKAFFLLPGTVNNRLESFAAGFFDALLAGVRRPKVFLVACVLTCLAVLCDGLFICLACLMLGFPLSLGTALVGYAIWCVCSVLPMPPGQVGSSELVGLLVFGALLHLPGNEAFALFLFIHIWSALLMAAVGFSCLKALGLTLFTALTAPVEPEKNAAPGM